MAHQDISNGGLTLIGIVTGLIGEPTVLTKSV